MYCVLWKKMYELTLHVYELSQADEGSWQAMPEDYLSSHTVARVNWEPIIPDVKLNYWPTQPCMYSIIVTLVTIRPKATR